MDSLSHLTDLVATLGVLIKLNSKGVFIFNAQCIHLATLFHKLKDTLEANYLQNSLILRSGTNRQGKQRGSTRGNLRGVQGTSEETNESQQLFKDIFRVVSVRLVYQLASLLKEFLHFVQVHIVVEDDPEELALCGSRVHF